LLLGERRKDLLAEKEWWKKNAVFFFRFGEREGEGNSAVAQKQKKLTNLERAWFEKESAQAQAQAGVGGSKRVFGRCFPVCGKN